MFQFERPNARLMPDDPCPCDIHLPGVGVVHVNDPRAFSVESA